MDKDIIVVADFRCMSQTPLLHETILWFYNCEKLVTAIRFG